ncbi:hypothetical protein [Caulobacter segnis]|uniref:hypothetical protein n=1 Tax=Caulobacter segnis TaxID=88688 RepID=UPI00285C0A8B|nr:hypothetical protein [Caulobacter segnis]MDR6624633.1 hypothetical protein [Caulobacter segnis]
MVANAWFSVAGLAFDFAGVALLGFDLVRLQIRLRSQARKSREFLDEISSDYGGTYSWAQEIKKSATWYPESSYSDYHAEDETSFNARNTVEQVREISECTSGLAEHISKITTYLDQGASENNQTAFMSFWLSIAGLFMILIGFVLQVIGTYPQ